MDKATRLALGVAIILLLLAACNLPEEPTEVPQSQEPAKEEIVSEENETGIDYCNLPAGTPMTWFDLSTFIFVPQNNFQMGFDQPDEEVDYEPVHQISLDAFWMHETEVTNRQYARCVAAGVCDPPESFADMPYWIEQVDRQDEPVVGVDWEQADAYCEWIGARLPTEAEWELSARGPESFVYPWGPEDPICDLANFDGCQKLEESQPVLAGSLLEGISQFKIFEMSANVGEWVSDWYADDYYLNSPAADPPGPENGEQRVFRGGGYLTQADQLQSYLRDALEPDQAQPDLGFRCALDCGSGVPPQLCQLPPAVGGDLPVSDPQPVPQPEVEISAYCENRSAGPSAGVVLSSPDGLDLSQYEFSSPNGPITCNPVGEMVVCYGPGIQPDTTVTLTICPECGPGFYFDQVLGMCRPILSVQVGQLTIDPEPEECGEGYVDTEDYGCILNALVPISCEDGYYFSGPCGCIPDGTLCAVVEEPETVVVVEPTPIELVLVTPTPIELVVVTPTPIELVIVTPTPTPLFDPYCCDGDDDDELPVFPGWLQIPPLLSNFPLLPGDLQIDPQRTPMPPDPDTCGPLQEYERCPPNQFPLEVKDGCFACIPVPTNPDCPEGYSFDPAVNCCTPDTPVLTCPPGTMLDLATGACIPIPDGGDDACFELSAYVPACPPLQIPTKEVTCIRPSQYNNQEDCVANSCKWQISDAGAPFCTYP